MKIRYRGGPLNRHGYYGPSTQPKYRDDAGNVLDYPTGQDRTSARGRAEIARVAIYVYNPQLCAYEHIGRLVEECDTAQLQRETEDAA